MIWVLDHFFQLQINKSILIYKDYLRFKVQKFSLEEKNYQEEQFHHNMDCLNQLQFMFQSIKFMRILDWLVMKYLDHSKLSPHIIQSIQC